MYSRSSSISFGHSDHIPFVISNANSPAARNPAPRSCSNPRAYRPVPVPSAPVLCVVTPPAPPRGYNAEYSRIPSKFSSASPRVIVAPRHPRPLGVNMNVKNSVSIPHRFPPKGCPSYYHRGHSQSNRSNPPPMLNTIMSNSDHSSDHSNHITALPLNHSLKLNGANTMISGLSSFSSLSASSNATNPSTLNINNSAHHIQPPPAISVMPRKSDSKTSLFRPHSPGATGSSAHETSSICNTDIATNDLEGSSSLPIDLTRSNTQSTRHSVQSTAMNSVSASHSSSPSSTHKQSPNPLHNPVVNSVADLTIGRSKPLSNGLNAMNSANGLKRRLQDHSTSSPRVKRPKLDHNAGLNGLNGTAAGRGMMNLLNLHNPGGIANVHRANGPNSNPLQNLQRSLLAGKQQQRSSVAPTGSRLPNSTGKGPAKPPSKPPVALTLQQLINYLGKGSMPNVNPRPPVSKTVKSPPHPPCSAMPAANRTTIPSGSCVPPTTTSSSRLGQSTKSINQQLSNGKPPGQQQLNIQNLLSRLKQMPRSNSTHQALLNLISSKGLPNGNTPVPSLAALTRSAKQYALNAGIQSSNGHNLHSRTHNLRPLVDSKNTPPVFTVSNSGSSARPSSQRHPGSSNSGRDLMTLLQSYSNHNARRALSNGVGAKALTAKYSNILNPPNSINPNALRLNGMNPILGHHNVTGTQSTRSTSRSMAESQPNSLSNSRTVSPSKKKEIPIILLSDDDEDEEVSKKSTDSIHQITNRELDDQFVPELVADVGGSDGGLHCGISDQINSSKPLNTTKISRSDKRYKNKKAEERDSENVEPSIRSSTRSKSRSKKRKERRDRSRHREHERERKRKRKRSPSATSMVSMGSLVSDTRSQCTTGSDESYKADKSDCKRNGEGQSNESSHSMVTRRQRRKRTCNIDKEFDAEEHRIKLQEHTVQEPVSGNAYIVAYAESLHLDEMQMRDGEVFPVLREMPRSSLIAYCDYYKLRHSKRSKDNRLLQIVTKHFILHNREKNGQRSIEDMERDLFWHSVCHQHNSRGSAERDKKRDREKEEKKESPDDGNSDPRTS